MVRDLSRSLFVSLFRHFLSYSRNEICYLFLFYRKNDARKFVSIGWFLDLVAGLVDLDWTCEVKLEYVFFYSFSISFTLIFYYFLADKFLDFFFISGKKKQTIPKLVDDPSKLPKWNYDGSSTGQAPGEDSEVIL